MNCKHCGATLRFVTMESGRRMPCDPIAVPANTAGTLIATYPRKFPMMKQEIVVHVNGHVVTANRPPAEGAELYVPHWATCPSSGKRRR